jgi:peptide-methionine (S)-S-oxide reductase
VKRAARALALVVALALPVCACADEESATPAPSPAGTDMAVFAGGCFWCMEKPFDQVEGVLSTTSGYTGGHVEAPAYEQVSGGGTGHLESVRVVYDPQRVSYEKLLGVFWHNVDPLDAGGQFCDRGTQYGTAIFVHDAEQRRLAEASKQALEASGRFDQPVVTPIREAGPFYEAEDYHQDYYLKNPVRYAYYRYRCGRDARLEALWGDEAGH